MKIKYPRTHHVEWSEAKTSDDKVQSDLSSFEDQYVIFTEKMDGENTTMMHDYFYARSLDSNNHPSRNYAKGLWGNIKHLIPENFRICGENLYAKHSIYYDNLPDYFLVFSIWDGDKCLSWSDTLEYCDILGLKTVNVLYRGKFNLDEAKAFKIDTVKQEGYVIRLESEFTLSNFKNSVVKWVRSGHVQTDEHWMSQRIVKNGLISF